MTVIIKPTVTDYKTINKNIVMLKRGKESKGSFTALVSSVRLNPVSEN